MPEDKFILLNLEEPKSKELAQVISSNTARKILELLSEKSLSESDIAKKLNIPLPTAHYNIKQLLKANLIEIEDFLWSEKGKKIQIYKLANKLIIIAPKTSSVSFLEKIKEIVPVVLTSFLISIGIYVYQTLSLPKAREIPQIDTTYITEGETLVATRAEEAISTSLQTTNYALWFFLGIISLTLIYLIFSYFKTRKSR